MPELPEVETSRRGVEPYLSAKRISRLVVRQPKLRWPIPAELPALVAGKTIKSVRRRAKYLLIDLSAGSMIVHLGMSGSVRIVDAKSEPGKHDHFDLVLAGGRCLRFHDPRRFGCLLWAEGDVSSHRLLAELGPEPLSDEFDGERLHRLSRKRRTAVKAFIMDNATVVGVGNIYANEALFEAGIRPGSAAGRLSRARCDRLAEEIKIVLARAIEQGGTTLRDFVGGDGKPGYFAQQLKVYGRAGLPCPNCHELLVEKRMAGRSTVYCRDCQR